MLPIIIDKQKIESQKILLLLYHKQSRKLVQEFKYFY